MSATIWKCCALILLGVALGLCIAFRLRKPEMVIEQQIKKLKQRGNGNSQDADMQVKRQRRNKKSRTN